MQLELYRTAGELFGRLRQSVGFGELVMIAEDRAVSFRWTFKSGNERYYCQWTSTDVELSHIEHIESFADDIASGWKAEHRTVEGSEHASEDQRR